MYKDRGTVIRGHEVRPGQIIEVGGGLGVIKTGLLCAYGNVFIAEVLRRKTVGNLVLMHMDQYLYPFAVPLGGAVYPAQLNGVEYAPWPQEYRS